MHCNVALEVGEEVDDRIAMNDFRGARRYVAEMGDDLTLTQRRRFMSRIKLAQDAHEAAVAVAEDGEARANYLQYVPFGD